MALNLDATLAAAQDSQSRHPLVEIVSSQSIADIPFDGSRLTAEAFNEFAPNVIAHTTGRLCGAYCYGPDADGDCGIKYIHTDIDRQEFNTVTIELFTTTAYVMIGVSVCELTNGNICLAYLYTYNSKYYLASRVVTVEGAAVSTTAIGNWDTTIFTSGPWVHAIGTDSYLMVYAKQSGSDYFIYKRTSADGVTWSAESALTIGGLTSTFKLNNPSMLTITTGDFWLLFDVLESTGPTGATLTNVYYSVSTDGVTWADAVKITNYTTYSVVATHPAAVQKTANQMHVIYNQVMGALHMDDTATGWPTGNETSNVSYDTVNRKVYVVNGYNSAGGGISCIVRIDMDTWAVDSYWDAGTVPAIPSRYCPGSGALPLQFCVQDGQHIAYATINLSSTTAMAYIMYLDGGLNTITEYSFSAYGQTPAGNTSGSPHSDIAPQSGSLYDVHAMHMDAASNKLWIAWKYPYYAGQIIIGYIDITVASNYAFNTVFTTSGMSADDVYGFGATTTPESGGMWADVAGNRVVLTTTNKTCFIFDLSSGALIDKIVTTYPLQLPTVYGSKIYCGCTQGVHGEENCITEIDMDTATFIHLVPTYATDKGDQVHYNFSRPCHLQDGKIAVIHHPFGLCIYDSVTGLWSRYSNSSIAGFTNSGYEPGAYSQIVYDTTNDMIMFGDWNITDGPYIGGHYSGVIAIPLNGDIKQSYYMIGTCTAGVWAWASAAVMVRDYYEYEMVAVVEPGSISSMYVLWTSKDVNNLYSIKLDKDGSSMDISAYITDVVTEEKNIDGSISSLSFTVSHGHLFDPYNSSSILSEILKKGRTLTLKWGEKISGADYWQESGVYFVTETSMEFRRGQYPVMNVTAEDRRALWTHKHIYVTEAYNSTPKTIIDDILADFGGMASGDINTPVISSSLIQQQWIETTIDAAVNQLCERFGYYFRFDYQGKAHARLITNVGAIDHTYSDATKLIKWSPDDNYSDFTNRVTVRGQELTFTEVTYAEERITSLSGTLGWWGCKADHVVWFSDDKSRRAINPRLLVIESATAIALQLAGGVEEYLVACGTDDDDKFCTVYVEAPSLLVPFIANISVWAAAHAIPDWVNVGGFIYSTGVTISVGRLIEGAGMLIAMMILGSVANYQLEVWAQPLGEIRRSIQATANDLTHQTEINAIIEQVIDDPLCYSFADCMAVADFELMICQMQRRRVKIEKIAHLQDEDGDTIRLVHPYSGQNIDIFIAKLARKFKKATVDGDGYFLDDIEGWVL